ncbi:MAG: hypothetical protein OXU33_12415 [Gemmatimonadota bacterium]|nr:hypothetical protein [Gemmatimonadota bacterium]MDE3014864.1 hypothetical protein [Gemmatimonadota bacterium]
MKHAKRGTIMVVVGLITPAAALEAQQRGPGGSVGLSFVAANPVGEMGTLVDYGLGVQVSGSAPMAAGGHLRMRLDLGAVVYGSEELFYCDFTCRVGSDVTTTNSILYGSVGPEIVLMRGDIEPYVHAGAGLSFFVTSSHMDDNDGYQPYLETTNYSDMVLGWRFGGGLRFRTGVRTFIDLGVEKVDNQVANFLTEGDVVDQPDGSVLLYPNRSDADLMTFRLGVSFAFR